MAYTPDAEDTAQPTGNQALSTAALEFRTLKTYIQATKTAQDVRDDAQDVATALVASNLAAALVAQDSRDDAQDVAITAAAALGTAASALAGTKANKVALSGVGTWTVPAGVTSVRAILQGGGSAQAQISGSTWGALSWAFYAEAYSGDVVIADIAVTPGASMAYTCGAGQDLIRDPASGSPFTPCYIKTLTASGETTFGGVVARPAITRYAVSTTGFVTREASTFGASATYNGQLVDTRINGAAHTPDTTSITAGKAGTITLLY
jgi:hypothetical protein